MTAPRAVLALIVAALAAGGAWTLQPQLFGLHHDDGLYLTSAQSLADGAGYRLPSVPGSPPAAKYPPLYPVLASAVLSVQAFPQGVLALKLLNVAWYAAAVLGFFVLARRRLDDEWAAVALTASFGLCPIVVLYLDYTMTESLFLALTPAWLLAWGRAIDGGRRGAIVVAPLVLLALLATKAVALAFAAASAIDAARRGRWALAFGVTAVTGAWMGLWRMVQPDADVPRLLEYYLSYEPSLLAVARADPGLALGAALGNVRYYLDALHMAIGPGWALAPIAWLVIAGLWVRRASIDAVALLCALGLLALYPGAMPRYLLPLAPLLLLLAGAGARALWRAAALPPVGLPASFAVLALVSLVPYVSYVRHHPHELIAPARWQGFLDAARWLETHTPQEAVIASGYDQVYYLASGRRGVRPWRHDAFSYYHPYGRAVARVGDATDVRADLRALGVEYLIVEPMDYHREGPAVEAMLERLVALPPAAVPVFTNDEGRRVVYRLR